MAFYKVEVIMKRFFYVFDEHDYVISECKKMGMHPLCNTGLDKFICEGDIYTILSAHECYSGWEMTLMKEPELGYDDLVWLVYNTRLYSERVGALGILLIRHRERFQEFLAKQPKKDKKTHKIKKMIVKELAECSHYVREMKDLIEICRC